MSWKPVTQPAADCQPSSSNTVVFSSRKASLQDLVEKEKQNGPVIGISTYFSSEVIKIIHFFRAGIYRRNPVC